MSWEFKAITEGLSSVGEETFRNGVPVGIVRGYIASFQPDIEPGRYGKPDRFHPGAFLNAIKEHKNREDRQIRFKDHHGRTIGGFPIDLVYEDKNGLWAEGEINLKLEQGRDAYALAQQGVLTDFSIGFKAVKENLSFTYRDIFEARIGEASIIDEPKNRGARILEVKGLNTLEFHDLDLAPADYRFDEEKALERINEMPFSVGNGAHAFLDQECKLLIGDVVEGKLVAVPAAIRAAAQELKGHEGEEEQLALAHHVERYLAKMNEPSPFEEKQYFSLDEVKTWDAKGFEMALRATGRFSRAAVRHLLYRNTHPETKGKIEMKECSGSQSCPECKSEFKCSERKSADDNDLERAFLSGMEEFKQSLHS